jgi:hypothetical protein
LPLLSAARSINGAVWARLAVVFVRIALLDGFFFAGRRPWTCTVTLHRWLNLISAKTPRYNAQKSICGTLPQNDLGKDDLTAEDVRELHPKNGPKFPNRERAVYFNIIMMV